MKPFSKVDVKVGGKNETKTLFKAEKKVIKYRAQAVTTAILQRYYVTIPEAY